MLHVEVITVGRVDFSNFQDKVNSFLATIEKQDLIDIAIKVYDVKFVAVITYIK